MEPTESEMIAKKAIEFCEALREFGHTRKDEDKRRVVNLQQELLSLCPLKAR